MIHCHDTHQFLFEEALEKMEFEEPGRQEFGRYNWLQGKDTKLYSDLWVLQR